MEEKSKEPKTPMTGFESITEDLVQNILKRLPALSFASAACVSKSWYQICNRILSKPKLASAFSLNPDEKGALEEVVNKVLSEAIRPHFAIANVIGSGVDFREKLDLLAAQLGSKTTLIVSSSSGIMGRDVTSDEHREVMVEELWQEGESNSSFGIILTVGFLPGLKVEAIPLLRPRRARQVDIDKFVMDITSYAASVSGSTSPVGIIMFGCEDADQKPVMKMLDHAMSKETIIVGNERAQFLYKSGIESLNVSSSNRHIANAVTLVFARDQDKPLDAGEIHLHAAFVGPRYKVVSVKEIGSAGRNTWLTARREGGHEILDGQRILDDINNELVNQIGCPELYIGVTKQRKCFIGSEKPRLVRHLVFHGVTGLLFINRGDEEYLFADGVGIKTGDYFRFYHSDPSTASSSCNNVSKTFRNLKLDWSLRNCLHAGGVPDNAGNEEPVGGFVFARCGRGESLFGCCNVDSSPFLDNFPGVPMAGIFCCGEIGRGFSILNEDEGYEESSPCCCLHYYSTVYLLASYTPPAQH